MIFGHALVLPAILKWLKDNIHIVLLVALLVTSHAFVYVKGRASERALLKPQITTLTAKLAKLEQDHKAASDAAQAERERERAAELKRLVTLKEHYEDRVHANNAAADSLRGELRRARSAVRPLAPAAAAPAACRDYEADRTKLPERDADLLVDFARRCDAAAIQANSCAEYALGLHAQCSAPGAQ